MEFEIVYSSNFLKDIKKLQKIYKNIKQDLEILVTDLENNPKQGVSLGNGFYKIRLKNSDNTKGKSGGYRTITYYDDGAYLYLLTIYSKNSQESISDSKIKNILKEILI